MASMLWHAPQFYARIGGVLYLLIIAAAPKHSSAIESSCRATQPAPRLATSPTMGSCSASASPPTSSTFVCAVAVTVIL
jgi:hypothetical protein